MAKTESDGTVSGACLCGVVRFEVDLPTSICAHCHCTQCRRAHGAAFVTWFTLPKTQWRVTDGADDLRVFRSSDHARRFFCARCGSSLFFETDRDPGRIDIVLANMQGPIDRAPQLHIWHDERVAWVESADDLPRLGRGGSEAAGD